MTSVLNVEGLLSKSLSEWFEAPEDERDLVARDFLCGLVLYIEKAEKMVPLLARAHLKSLYAKWVQFCKDTEIDLGDNDVERYDEALFGSAIICLNDGRGKEFVVKHKMIWSKICIQQFRDWIHEYEDEHSTHYKSWVR